MRDSLGTFSAAAAVLLLAGLLAAGAAHAQPRTDSAERASVGIYVGAGLSNPSGPDDFKDNWNVGTNLSGGVAFRLNRRLMLRPALTYHSFNLGSTEFAGASGDYSILTATADLLVELRYNPFPVWPYFVVGGGVFNGEKDVSNVPDDENLGILSSGQTRFGLNGGVGAKTHFTNNLAAFLEGKFVVGFTGELGVMFGTGFGGLIVQF